MVYAVCSKSLTGDMFATTTTPGRKDNISMHSYWYISLLSHPFSMHHKYQGKGEPAFCREEEEKEGGRNKTSILLAFLPPLCSEQWRMLLTHAFSIHGCS